MSHDEYMEILLKIENNLTTEGARLQNTFSHRKTIRLFTLSLDLNLNILLYYDTILLTTLPRLAI